MTAKQREFLVVCLENATEAIADARRNLDREWIGRGIIHLREAEEYLQIATVTLQESK